MKSETGFITTLLVICYTWFLFVIIALALFRIWWVVRFGTWGCDMGNSRYKIDKELNEFYQHAFRGFQQMQHAQDIKNASLALRQKGGQPYRKRLKEFQTMLQLAEQNARNTHNAKGE